MNVRLAIAAAVACSCGELRIDVPIQDTTKTIIVGFERNEERELYAFELPDNTVFIPWNGRDPIEVTANTYDRTLCELMLEPGQIAPAITPRLRTVPEASATWSRSVGEGGTEEWLPISSESSPLSSFVLDANPKICTECSCAYFEGRCDCGLELEGPKTPEVPEPPRPLTPPFDPPVLLPRVCDPDQVRWYGGSECEPVGRPCPAGLWPDDLPAGARYVDLNAAPGGDGTIAAPYRTFPEAVAVSIPDDVIVLSKGTHAIGDRPRATGVTVIGACVAETVLSEGLIEVRDAMFTNLRFLRAELQVMDGTTGMLDDVVTDGSPFFAVFVHPGATVFMRRSVIRRANWAVHAANDATFDLEDLVIEQENGGGITATSDSQMRIVRTVIVGSGGYGVNVGRSVTATLEDVAVLTDDGFGVILEAFGEVDGSRIAIKGAGIGVATSSGSRASIDDLVIEDTGQGVLLFQPDFDVRIRRARIDNSIASAVSGFHPGGLHIEDISISGADVAIALGPVTATIARARIFETESFSIQTRSATVVLNDIATDGGLELENSVARIQRIDISQGQPFGIVSSETRLLLEDARIYDSGNGNSVNRTAYFQYGPIRIHRMVFERNAGGMGMKEPKLTRTATVTDLSILDLDEPAISLQDLNFHLERIALSRVHDGMRIEDGADVVVKDLSIDGIEGGVTSAGIGCEGRMRVESFAIRRSSGFGVRVTGGGELDLDLGEIWENNTGAGYREGYSFERLMNRIRYRDNRIDLTEF